jgi:hypothetical protein
MRMSVDKGHGVQESSGNQYGNQILNAILVLATNGSRDGYQAPLWDPGASFWRFPMPFRTFSCRIAPFLALALMAAPSVAETYPARPVTMIVPAPTGGGTDVFARVLAEIVETELKQKFVVENRAGAGAHQHGFGVAVRVLAFLYDRAVILQSFGDDIPLTIVHQHDVAWRHMQPAQVDDDLGHIRESSRHLSGLERPKALLSLRVERRYLVSGADILNGFGAPVGHENRSSSKKAAGTKLASYIDKLHPDLKLGRLHIIFRYPIIKLTSRHSKLRNKFIT